MGFIFYVLSHQSMSFKSYFHFINSIILLWLNFQEILPQRIYKWSNLEEFVVVVMLPWNSFIIVIHVEKISQFTKPVTWHTFWNKSITCRISPVLSVTGHLNHSSKDKNTYKLGHFSCTSNNRFFSFLCWVQICLINKIFNYIFLNNSLIHNVNYIYYQLYLLYSQ